MDILLNTRITHNVQCLDLTHLLCTAYKYIFIIFIWISMLAYLF